MCVYLHDFRFLRHGLCAGLLFALAACQPEGVGKRVLDEPATVGLCLPAGEDAFCRAFGVALEEQAGAANLVVKTAPEDGDTSTQSERISRLLEAGVDALLVMPAWNADLRGALRGARDKGIPLFTLGTPVRGVEVVCHVAPDGRKAGRLLGEFVAVALATRGKVGRGKLAILGASDAPPYKAMQDGWAEALDKYKDLRSVEAAPCPPDPKRAPELAQGLLLKHSTVDAILALHDVAALSALQAVQAQGLADSVLIVGFGSSDIGLDAIAAGSALVVYAVPDAADAAAKAASVLTAHFLGESVPRHIVSDIHLMDMVKVKQARGESLEETRVQELL